MNYIKYTLNDFLEKGKLEKEAKDLAMIIKLLFGKDKMRVLNEQLPTSEDLFLMYKETIEREESIVKTVKTIAKNNPDYNELINLLELAIKDQKEHPIKEPYFGLEEGKKGVSLYHCLIFTKYRAEIKLELERMMEENREQVETLMSNVREYQTIKDKK